MWICRCPHLRGLPGQGPITPSRGIIAQWMASTMLRLPESFACPNHLRLAVAWRTSQARIEKAVPSAHTAPNPEQGLQRHSTIWPCTSFEPFDRHLDDDDPTLRRSSSWVSAGYLPGNRCLCAALCRTRSWHEHNGQGNGAGTRGRGPERRRRAPATRTRSAGICPSARRGSQRRPRVPTPTAAAVTYSGSRNSLSFS